MSCSVYTPCARGRNGDQGQPVHGTARIRPQGLSVQFLDLAQKLLSLGQESMDRRCLCLLGIPPDPAQILFLGAEWETRLGTSVAMELAPKGIPVASSLMVRIQDCLPHGPHAVHGPFLSLCLQLHSPGAGIRRVGRAPLYPLRGLGGGIRGWRVCWVSSQVSRARGQSSLAHGPRPQFLSSFPGVRATRGLGGDFALPQLSRHQLHHQGNTVVVGLRLEALMSPTRPRGCSRWRYHILPWELDGDCIGEQSLGF